MFGVWLDSVVWFFEELGYYFDQIIQFLADFLDSFFQFVAYTADAISMGAELGSITPVFLGTAISSAISIAIVLRVVGR